MANAPDAATLAEFKRLVKEANEVSLSHDEYLTLVFMAAADLYAAMPAPARALIPLPLQIAGHDMTTTREDAVLFAMSVIRRSTDWQEAQHAMADNDRIHAWVVQEAGDDDDDCLSVCQSVIREAENRLGDGLPAGYA